MTAELAGDGDTGEARRFHAIFEHARDGILVADGHGRYLDANPSACALMGYQRDELLALRVSDVTPPEEMERMGEQWQELFEGGELEGECTLLRGDGTRVPVEFRAVANVTPGVHISVLRDISGRKERERLVQRQLAQQAAVADLGRYALSSRSTDDLSGLAAAVSARVLEVDLVDVARRVDVDLDVDDEATPLAIVATGGSPPRDLDLAGRDGTWVVAERALTADHGVVVHDLAELEPADALRAAGFRSAASAIVRTSGSAWGFVTAHSTSAAHFSEGDLTFLRSVAHVVGLAVERDRRLQEVRERETYIDLLLRQLPVLLWSVDRDLVVTFVAGSVMKEVGIDPGEDVGRSFFEAIGPGGGEVATAMAAHRLALAGEPQIYELAWRGFHWAARIEPLRATDGEIAGVVGAAVDITATIAMRAELQESLTVVERMSEERGELLRQVIAARDEERRRISQELHDDLGQVLTSTALLARALEQDVPSELAATMTSLRELIEQGMASARAIVSSLRPDVSGSLGLMAALRRLASAMADTHRIHIDLHGSGSALPVATPVATAAYRIVQEAIANSVKHSGATSVSVVVTGVEELVTIVVEDDGAGFDLREAARGAGHGLAVMRERAEAVGGSLVVSSAPGGTAVRLELPTAVPPTP